MFLKKYNELPKKLFGIIFWNMFFFLLFAICIRGILIITGNADLGIKGVDMSITENFIYNILTLPIFSFLVSGLIWLFLIVGNVFLRLFIRIITLFNRKE